ncbi:MAG: AMP-binding protein [Candidatus Wallbacteria bacterium]|nr:AMP-binding protein [Candidatus Wallbacteria bacterium]
MIKVQIRFNKLIAFLARAILRLRYQVRITGLRKIESRGVRSILLLPNHPALIDPIILNTWFYPHFKQRTLADHDQIDRPLISWLGKRFGVITLPDITKLGGDCAAEIDKKIRECGEILAGGDNLLFYPAGRLARGKYESIGGNSAVETILRQHPDTRVVLVRTRGLWGSSFSRTDGHAPFAAVALSKGLSALLKSLIFFVPKREITIELIEPSDFPGKTDRLVINRYLENFYNFNPVPNLYVPYTCWESGGRRIKPEPVEQKLDVDVSEVPDPVRSAVQSFLCELTGSSGISESMSLAGDLGLDSLARVQIASWVEETYGFPQGNPDALQSVADVMLASCGQAVSARPVEISPVPGSWFTETDQAVSIPEGNTLTEVFLKQARKNKVAIADQMSGVKSYRDLVAAVFLLKPEFEMLPGERIGLLLPASVSAATAYFALLFSGKTPVMINWTVGQRSLTESLNKTGVSRIVTSRTLIARLKSQGNDLSWLQGLVFLEDLAEKFGFFGKIWAIIRAFHAQSLAKVKVSETAVILFTSGSENLPKAVPLTHGNLLANLRDISGAITLHQNDCLIGFLPPFHSFGLTGTILLPLCLGIRTVYHPNPTEALTLARLIESYSVGILVGTPTFLAGILRIATAEQLSSLRLAFVGAEKCPERVYEKLTALCPRLALLEGYGITECSPVISINDQEKPVPYTIGRVLPSLSYAIVHPETLEQVQPGGTGMLLVSGISIFSGYFGGESAFVKALGKTWYKTGDLVSEDQDRVLTFKGRLKRFVKLGGEMVSLPAIEYVLAPHFTREEDDGPGIAVEASGDPPEIVLFTIRDTDRETANRLLREGGLSGLHNVRRVVKVDKIPVLGTGKADYRALREMLTQS